MMDAGNINWRPLSSEGLSDDGPKDRTILIDFSGNIARFPYFSKASYGNVLDLQRLAREVDILFNKEWLRDVQYAKVDLVPTGAGFRIIAKVDPPMKHSTS